MADFSICWNRTRIEHRRDPESSHWRLECVLTTNALIEGRPVQQIVARLGAIDEELTDHRASADAFWHHVRTRLGRLRRLTKPAKPPPMAGRKQEVRQLRE
jgi:hypothetical protein